MGPTSLFVLRAGGGLSTGVEERESVPCRVIIFQGLNVLPYCSQRRRVVPHVASDDPKEPIRYPIWQDVFKTRECFDFGVLQRVGDEQGGSNVSDKVRLVHVARYFRLVIIPVEARGDLRARVRARPQDGRLRRLYF